MKWLLATLLLCCLGAGAQMPPTAGYVTYQGNQPSGSCNYPSNLIVVNTSILSNGGVYQCTGSPLAWNQVGVLAGVASIDGLQGAFTFNGPGVTHAGNAYTFSGSGSGISSITWALPSWLSASPSTISGGGTQTFSPKGSQTAHQVIGTCGTSTLFQPCSLTVADIPALPYLPSTSVVPVNTTATAHQFLNSYVASSGAFTAAQPSFSDVSGSVAATQLPNPAIGALGGVQAVAAVAHQWVGYVNPSGLPVLSQPSFSDVSGSVAAAQLPLGSPTTFGAFKCDNVTVTCASGVLTAAATGMVYPSAGVALSTGTAWGTSLTAPTGALVGTTDTQTLTAKTIDGVTPTTMGFVDPTSSIQTQLNARVIGTSLTTGFVPKVSAAEAVVNSAIDDGVTTTGVVTVSKPLHVVGGGASYNQPGTNVFSALPSCVSGLLGAYAVVSDSTTNTWGITVTGGGALPIMAFCDGSAWTVMAR